jgi:predicted ATPase
MPCYGHAVLGPAGSDVRSAVPIVGRDEEMAALRRWSAEAAGGRGRLVLCSGEPGVGKTRLMAAVADDARPAGSHMGWGHCLDGDGSVPFRPWLDVLRPLVARQPHPPAALDGFLAGPAGRTRSPTAALPDAAARERAFDAVVTLLRAVGEAGGVLVVPAEPAGVHRFVHALVRDAVQEDLASVARARWHRVVAETIERYYTSDLTFHLSDLARHRVVAAPSAPDGVDQAVRWCERAADDALVRLAWEEAARLYGVALDVGGQLGWEDRCRLLLGRARARFRSAELAEALDDSLEAARLARSAGRGDLVGEAALVLQAVGDPGLLAPVRDLCEEALAVPDLAPTLRARLLAQVALACFYLDPDRRDRRGGAGGGGSIPGS